MALLAGIDEAGYGPMLGPLVVSGVCFRVPDEAAHACLWDRLSESCVRIPTRGDRRLPIADSKKLYRSGDGLDALERAALVMLHVAGKKPGTWRALLDVVADGASREVERYPWYALSDFPLPLSPEVGDVGTRANAVRRNAKDRGVEFLGAFCAPLLEGEFNRVVSRTRNKAATVVGQAINVLDRMLRTSDERQVRICVDRLGGRAHYREVLQTAFQGYDLRILEETPERSSYELTSRWRTCHIDFTVDGEDHHFPIALASVYSKYLRELYMHSFNAFWGSQMSELKPTAGYYADARRWLRDASPILRSLAVKREMLVRRC